MSNTSLLGSYGGHGNSSLMFRNRVINGDMRIDQRNSGAAVTQQTGALFPVDRFRVLGSVSNKFTAQQNAGAITPPSGFTHYLGMTSSAATTVSASDYYLLQHNLEGFNVADFGWGTAGAQTVSISFWARSSLTGTHSGSFQNSAGDRSYVFTYSISVANTWEYKTISVPGDTSGTWLKDSGLGIKVTWSLGSGSTFLAAANAWSAGNFFGATGSINVVGTNGATLQVTGVQIEAEVATPFERRPIGVEEQLCFRYFWKWKAGDTAITYASITGAGLNSAATTIYTPVSMRIIPTISHNFSNANFVTTGPTGVQWGVLISGVAFSNKTGTASFSPLATSTNAVTFRIISADFTSAINTLTVGPSVYIDVSAEL
jgi:hypothetical protein